MSAPDTWHDEPVSTTTAQSPPRPATAVDRLLAVVYGIAGVLTYTLGRPQAALLGGQEVPAWLWLPLVLAGVFLVGFRRSVGWPTVALGALVVAAFVLNGGIFTTVLLFELVFTVSSEGTHHHRRILWAYTVALAAGGGLAVLAEEGAWPSAVSVSLLVLGVVGIAGWWGASVRELTDEAETARAEHLAHRLARAEERAALAHDMHDVVAGRLAAISLQATQARRRVTDDPRLAELLDDIGENAADTLRRVRALIAELAEDPEGTHQRDPRADLAAAVTTARTVGVDVALYDALPGRLDPAVAEVVRSVALETVVNMTKHGARGPATVRLATDATDAAGAGAATLMAENPVPSGTGGPATTAPGLAGGRGIASMRARVAQLGGTLDAGPVLDPAGQDAPRWRVSARIPIEEVPDE